MGNKKRFSGEYPPNWPEISAQVKQEAGNRCERCKRLDDKASGYKLTVHHLDGNKSNCARWNLAALCQRCHLSIQDKVFLPQFYMFEHSEWFIPHLIGFYDSIGLQMDKALDKITGRETIVLVPKGGK
jgi:hypothetical protein